MSGLVGGGDCGASVRTAERGRDLLTRGEEEKSLSGAGQGALKSPGERGRDLAQPAWSF